MVHHQMKFDLNIVFSRYHSQSVGCSNLDYSLNDQPRDVFHAPDLHKTYLYIFHALA
jgi:hypothetical protein